jgi:plasmid stabilization system protein ParE
MTIEKSHRFNQELAAVLAFISEDSPQRALAFLDKLILLIEMLSEQPYLCRRRDTADDNYTRELIYKGYTIPYYIDTEHQKIIILGIFNQNKWKE